ncbi:MAG: CoA-binding protein [Spirochaetia bacterium]
MAVISKDFFTDNELVMMGYSRNPESFSRMVYKDLTDAGLRIFPVNPNTDSGFDVPVYTDITKISKLPKAGYILLSGENAQKAFKELMDAGVKRILFQEKTAVTPDIRKSADEAGIEIQSGCPLLAYGKGFHKLHAFFARLFSR